MGKCLLSIDWDYFIDTQINQGSYMENSKSLIDYWYKSFFQAEERGEDIKESFLLSQEIDLFWNKIRQCFQFAKDIKAYISDSHALSYQIADEASCNEVYLFDAHADLGYSGISLDFEVNCANWLGKLLKEKKVNDAYIIYSPYTKEKPEDFKQMNSMFHISYYDFRDLENKSAVVSAIHICRSGAWTPPWMDNRFYQFVDDLGLPYEMVDCPERKWDPEHVSLSDRINYFME